MIAVGRIVKAAGKLIFMDPEFSRIAENTLKASKAQQGWKGIHKQIGKAFSEAERRTYTDSFWNNLWKKQICGFPKDISTAWKSSSGLWGTTKAIGGKLIQRLPLIFAAFELPNIFSAFKDEGLVGGCVETLKSATRLTGSMAGFIAGQTLIPIPIVGGLIGAIGADWLISKVIGKSHSEKKAEAEEAKRVEEQQYQEQQQQLQQMQQSNPYMNTYGNQNQLASNSYINMRPTMTPQQMMAMKGMLYGGGMTNPMDQDFMAMTSGMNRLNYLC